MNHCLIQLESRSESCTTVLTMVHDLNSPLKRNSLVDLPSDCPKGYGSQSESYRARDSKHFVFLGKLVN